MMAAPKVKTANLRTAKSVFTSPIAFSKSSLFAKC